MEWTELTQKAECVIFPATNILYWPLGLVFQQKGKMETSSANECAEKSIVARSAKPTKRIQPYDSGLAETPAAAAAAATQRCRQYDDIINDDPDKSDNFLSHSIHSIINGRRA